MHLTRLLRILLLIGAAFYFFEFVIHFFGLPILEHDKIFLPTHDRYIALYGLTYASLFVLIATNILKYRQLFIVTMTGVLLGLLNAEYIASQKFYTNLYEAASLDRDLGVIGWLFGFWYAGTWLLWRLIENNNPSAKTP